MSMGYALAIHGSGIRDLDMIAIPFDPQLRCTPEELVGFVCEAINATIGMDKEYPIKYPHGRLCWILVIDAYHYVDFSVTPSVKEEENA